jgi:hypothetical protein
VSFCFPACAAIVSVHDRAPLDWTHPGVVEVNAIGAIAALPRLPEIERVADDKLVGPGVGFGEAETIGGNATTSVVAELCERATERTAEGGIAGEPAGAWQLANIMLQSKANASLLAMWPCIVLLYHAREALEQFVDDGRTAVFA